MMERQNTNRSNPFRLTQEELEALWLRINGQPVDQGDVPDEFTDGAPCCLLYSRMYDARERLSERAGIGFEDRDALEVIESLEEIGRRGAFRMAEYLSENSFASVDISGKKQHNIQDCSTK